MSIFGWSLPPGVTSSMTDPPEQPCEICGKFPDDCECPECPRCGMFGCIDHEDEFHLRGRLERLEYLVRCAKRELERRGKPLCLPDPDIAPADDMVDGQ